jgi:hypothetical protein
MLHSVYPPPAERGVGRENAFRRVQPLSNDLRTNTLAPGDFFDGRDELRVQSKVPASTRLRRLGLDNLLR